MKYLRGFTYLLIVLVLSHSATAAISITGVADKTVYADSVTFTVNYEAGYDYTCDLNGDPVATDVAIDVNEPEYYELYVHRINQSTSAEESQRIKFIVRDSSRGSSETGLPTFTPYPMIDSAAVDANLEYIELQNISDANLEYIELQNISDANLDITGVRFTEGIDFTFPSVILEQGEYIVIARDETLFETTYPAVDAIGEYTGALDNGGEDIILKLALPFKAAILRFDYDDAWYPSTDGGGSSLEIMDPAAHPATWDDAESWQPAAPNPGS